MLEMVFESLSNIYWAFILGLLTPLTAACVLPLYPGFLAYLSNQLSGKEDKKTLALFGIVITSGVLVFMFLVGLVFTTVLQTSLTNVVSAVSPIAFGILFLISLILIFDMDVGRILPKAKAPSSMKNPWVRAFTFGFFFGAIVIPCNPAFIAVFFTRTLSTIGFIENLATFMFFGLGMGSPLLVFSLVSTAKSASIISYLISHKKTINRIAGLFMLVVSIYYLTCVFAVFGKMPFIDPVCKKISADFGLAGSSLFGSFT